MSLINYVNAGYNAYRMAYSTGCYGSDHKPQRIDNPYSKRPFRELWLRGWREAQREFEMGGIRANFRHNPFSDNSRVLTFVRETERRENRANRKPSKFVLTNPIKPVIATPVKVKPRFDQKGKAIQDKPVLWKNIGKTKPKYNTAVATVPVINLNRLEKFNKKHRTVA